MKKLRRILEGLCVVALLTLLAGCFLIPHQVQYDVTGTATIVSISYTDPNVGGAPPFIPSTTLPWTYSFTAQDGASVSLTATNLFNTGTVTATISKDGKVWKTVTTSDPYGQAQVAGTL